jgi:hypothetical protein
LYIADSANHRILKIANGLMSTIAGDGAFGFSGDGGPAVAAMLSGPSDVTADAAGNIYIMDMGNVRVRKVHVATGIITTIAGTGQIGFSGDGGAATNATFDCSHFPGCRIAADGAGNVFLADTQNNRIRRIDGASGNITTVVGTGTPGYTGDNGPATSAQINAPSGIDVDGNGNLYIGVNGASFRVIRKVTNGIITTIAGGGTQPLSEGIAALSAALGGITSIATGNNGNIYFEVSSIRVWKLTGGVLRKVAGNDLPWFASNGTAPLGAQLNGPLSVSADPSGSIYFSQTAAAVRVSGAELRLATGGDIRARARIVSQIRSNRIVPSRE